VLSNYLALCCDFQENIHSIMESEGQINALMDSIDISVNALDEIDRELSSYDEAVKYVRKSVEKIEEENLQMGVAAKNNQLLLAELGNLIEVLDFPQSSYLSDPDLRTEDGIKKATYAALQLKETLNVDVRFTFKCFIQFQQSSYFTLNYLCSYRIEFTLPC